MFTVVNTFILSCKGYLNALKFLLTKVHKQYVLYGFLVVNYIFVARLNLVPIKTRNLNKIKRAFKLSKDIKLKSSVLTND